MRMNFLRVGVLSIFAAGLASCGGEPSQPLTSTSASTVLAQLNTVLGKLPRSNTAPTLPITGVTTAASKPDVQTMAATECETITPNPIVDADGDSIAATKTGTFDCSSQATGTYTYTRKGSYTVKDLDDSVAGMLGGMTASFNITSYDYTNSADGESGKGSHKGNWEFKGTGNGGMSSTADYTGRYAVENSNSSYVTDYVYGYTWTWSMTPDSAAAPWNTGSQSFKGDFSLNGKFANEVNGVHTQQNGTFRVSYQSKDLKYDTACTKWYRSGSIWMDDSNGTSIEVRYACSTAELYVNGAKSDWWTP